MQVTVDVSAAVHRRAGLGRYAWELVGAMQELEAPELDLHIFYAQASEAEPPEVIADLPEHYVEWGYKPWRLAAMASHFTNLRPTMRVSTPTSRTCDTLLE